MSSKDGIPNTLKSGGLPSTPAPPNPRANNNVEKGGGGGGGPNRTNYRKHSPTGRGGRRGGRGRGGGGRGGRGDGAKSNRNSSNKSPHKNFNKGQNKSPTRYHKNPNKHQTNRNGKGKETRQVETNVANLTDEDVLIAFGPLLKSGDMKAIRVHEQFKLDSNNTTFMANARRLVTSNCNNQNENGSDDNNKSNPLSSNKIRAQSSTQRLSSNNKHTSQLNHHDDPIINTPDRNEMELQLQSSKQSHAAKHSNNLNSSKAQNTNTTSQRNQNQQHSFPTPFQKIYPKTNSQNDTSVHAQMQQMSIHSSTNSNMHTTTKSRDLPCAPPPGLSIPPRVPSSSTPTQRPESNKGGLQQSLEKKETAPPKPKEQGPKPRVFVPKRLFRNQPGTLYANDKPPNATVTLRPRSELRARWSIPIPFLRDRTIEQSKKAAEAAASRDNDTSLHADGPPPINPNITIRDALETLCVGLFRLGCPENGQHFTIVSKNVLESGNFHIKEHPQIPEIWGEVPFYAPRSPGKVIFRLFFSDDPIQTIATGPLIHVDVKTGPDVDSTLRFLLSNFKSKKGAQISTMHSVATVFASFSPPPNSSPPRHYHSNYHNNHHNNHHNNPYDGAGRAAWGCVCESRKALDLAGQDFMKKKMKFKRAEEELLLWKEEHAKKEEEENEKNEAEEESKRSNSERGEAHEEKEESTVGGENDVETTSAQKEAEGSEVKESQEQESVAEREITLDLWKEKMGSLMGEKASNERKWRDAQVAYASILREALSNSSSSLLLRRDLLTKLRLEYELWCPICEAFAPNPFERNKPSSKSNDESSQQPVFNIYPHPITAHHFKLCSQSRSELRMETLEFAPRMETLPQLLSHKGTSAGSGNGGTIVGQQGKFTATGNTVLQRLSNVMQKLYSEQLCPSEKFYEIRELVRSKIEVIVNESKAFPTGTKVVLFGSVANGFGSPKSDLDMCIELPPGITFDTSDSNGSNAMAVLAEVFTKSGMVEVNTSRLSARIPIIMFEYPFEMSTDKTVLLQCDISMQNPLACLNTQLLKAYSSLDPRVCILASIIKRWAKQRNINNPSHHTLSSYGYIIMLLHFLTRPHGLPSSQPNPVLPNLQWIDPVALGKSRYSHLSAKPNHPQFFVRHPTEQGFIVNSYFYRPTDGRLHQVFSSNNQSVGYLLTAFFRYYAFEFNYKRHVVSLNNTTRWLTEKEIKAETDGWRLGAVANVLAIEDPFETFYDVAHVLKQSSFQRVKREFVRAYSKIVESVWNGEANGMNKGEALLDWICEDVSQQSS